MFVDYKNDQKYLKVHACAKHFAVHSGPERSRHYFDVYPTARDLWTTYLPAFEALVTKGNVQEVMCAYNRVEGKPACGNDHLYQILRQKWNYTHLVTSDCFAIDDFYLPRHHYTHPNASVASVDAVKNGTDIECGYSYRSLKKALLDNLIDEEELNIHLRRLFRGRFDLGVFDPDDHVSYAQIPFSVVESQEHYQQSLQMARESIVLLKNNGLLPLNKTSKKILLVGPNADNQEMQWGNYNGIPSKTVSILEGIKTIVPDSTVDFEQGCLHVDNFTN